MGCYADDDNSVEENCFLVLRCVVYKMAGMAGQQAVGLLGVNILKMYVSGVFGIHLLVVRRQVRPFSKNE